MESVRDPLFCFGRFDYSLQTRVLPSYLVPKKALDALFLFPLAGELATFVYSTVLGRTLTEMLWSINGLLSSAPLLLGHGSSGLLLTRRSPAG